MRQTRTWLFLTTLALSMSWPAVALADSDSASGGISGSIHGWMESNISWLNFELLSNEVWRYLFAIATIVVAYLVRRYLVAALLALLGRLATSTENVYDNKIIDAIERPLRFFLVVFGVYLGLSWLALADWLQNLVLACWRVSIILAATWAGLQAVVVLQDLMKAMAGKTQSKLDDYLVPLVSRVARIVVIGLSVVLIMEEVGFNVAGLLAGLGVGGLALALAAQDTVSNWFGALMLYTDQPFKVGDWIKTSALEGVVEEIGLRSTKIRTFSKTVISVPNSKLVDSTVENFSRRPIRRVNMSLGLTYSTTPAMMREALARLRDIIRNHPNLDKDFWLVKFTEFGGSALNIMVYFFTNTTDWERYLDIREDINLRIMESLNEIGVQFAFPSQSVYLEQVDQDEIRRLDEEAKELLSQRTPVDDIRSSMTAPSQDVADG